jgi:aldehyde dehydrogenase (NAD+)
MGARGVQARADILDQIGNEIIARKEELGTLLSREEGKTKPEGIGEAARAGYIFKFFAGEAIRAHGELVPSVRPGHRRRDHARAGRRGRHDHAVEFSARDPRVEDRACARVRQLRRVQARRPGPRQRMGAGEIISRTAIPPGVFNLVMGRGSVVGDVIVKSPDVDAISFTGSVPTGKNIARAAIEQMKKIQLEMGGKNPQVILDDADLDVAVNVALQSAYFSTGQRCTAASRLIVTQGIHDKFVEALAKRMGTLKIDDALKAGTDIGPWSTRASSTRTWAT